MSGKPLEDADVRQPVSLVAKTSTTTCIQCATDFSGPVVRCEDCGSGCYCSAECRKVHVPVHNQLCKAIQEAVRLEFRKSGFSVREVNQATVKNRLVSLVGEKPILNCQINNADCKALWDTGSMVSMVGKEWLEENFPDEEVMPVLKFLEGDDLHLVAANNTRVDVEGVAILELGVGGRNVAVPFVVCKEKLVQPLVGYNVIKHLVSDGKRTDALTLLLNSLPVMSNLSENSVKAVVNIVSADHSELEGGAAWTTTKLTVPANSRCRVKCRTRVAAVESKQSVLFTPEVLSNGLEMTDSVSRIHLGRTSSIHVVVVNSSDEDKVIPKGCVLGSVEMVSSVVPVGPRPKVEVNAVDVDADRVPVVGESEESLADPLSQLDLSHLPQKEQDYVRDALKEVAGVFQKDQNDIGEIPELQMEIPLTDNNPVCVPHRSIPRPLYDEVKGYVNDLVANQWVRESKSPYRSPICVVRKPDQTLRFCIDYRDLNRKIIPDRQPIPRIQEIIDSLGGQKWFSTLDMGKAYWQGFLKEEFRKVTAFSTPWGLYEWIRIPMGISNSPPVFQRHINQILHDLLNYICVAYLDDVLVYGKTFEDHVTNLVVVLKRLQSKGVKLRADKCVLLKQKVRYLGRLISEKGYEPDPKDTEALDKFRKAPQTIGELRTLLGFFGYYRNYIRNFSQKFKPLYSLLKSDAPSESRPKAEEKKRKQVPSKKSIQWSKECEDVVSETIEYLKSPKVMAFPDYSLPFILHCDASEKGLGAVLYQVQNGEKRVVSFASKTLSDAERNYHLHSGKLEFLALKWSITDRFADTLCSGPFTVYTDNNPLTYVMTSAKLNATTLRWANELADYQFTLKYKPGKSHGDADGLSRVSEESLEDLENECTNILSEEKVATIVTVCGKSEKVKCPEFVDVNMLQWKAETKVVEERIGRAEMKMAQEEDTVIGPVYAAVCAGKRPKKEMKKDWSTRSKTLLREFQSLKIVDDLLVKESKEKQKLVLPEKYHNLMYVELHEKMGHLGADRVIDLCKQRFYWPYMRTDITHYIQNQCRCIVSKQPNVPERAPLVPIESSEPFELVCIDFLKLGPCSGGYKYALLVTDHFTRFSQAYATKSKTSLAAARELYQKFIPQFGWPGRIHSDRGGEFVSEIMNELHRLSGVDVSRTTPYHPMGNGAVERLNRTLIAMLSAIPEDQKKNWKEHLPALMFAYNSTTHSSTGYSPFFLMFGRESRLPIDCLLPFEPNVVAKKTYKQFVDNWKQSMKSAFQIAQSQAEKSKQYNKKQYDNKIKHVGIEVGDRVLVRNVDKNEDRKIYEVIAKHDTVPVYTIKQLNGRKTRRVHRNMIMKVNDLPLDVFQKETKRRKPRVRKNSSPSEPSRSPSEDREPVVSFSSSDDDGALFIVEEPFVGGGGGPSEDFDNSAPDGNQNHALEPVEDPDRVLAEDPDLVVEEDPVLVVGNPDLVAENLDLVMENPVLVAEIPDFVVENPDPDPANNDEPYDDDVETSSTEEEVIESSDTEDAEQSEYTESEEEEVVSGVFDETDEADGSDHDTTLRLEDQEYVPNEVEQNLVEDGGSITDGSTGSVFHDAVEYLADVGPDEEVIGGESSGETDLSRPTMSPKRSKRISRHKPKARFTYNELGKPTYETYDSSGKPTIKRYSAYL